MTKTKFPMGIQPVLVEWIDSMGQGGWQHQVETFNLNCVSVGILIKKTKDRIVLSLNQNEAQNGEILQIPLFAVKRIRRLGYV